MDGGRTRGVSTLTEQFFFNDTATTEIYTLSLHDALPIYKAVVITLGIRWRGFPAWFIARTYHLLLMPGVGRRLRLLADWNVALIFGRDASAPGRLGSPTPLEPDGATKSPR